MREFTLTRITELNFEYFENDTAYIPWKWIEKCLETHEFQYQPGNDDNFYVKNI